VKEGGVAASSRPMFRFESQSTPNFFFLGPAELELKQRKTLN
jgi:hypothetical protein